MKKRFLILSLVSLLLCACVPRPEKEYVVAPSGYEAAIAEKSEATVSSDEIQLPVHWNEVIPLNYWDINIDAQIDPNAIGATPVYESSYLTMDDIQEQANSVKRKLLKNAEKICTEGAMTKADWYRQIQIFADTLAWEDATGGFTKRRSDEEVDSYRKSMEPFIAEAPIELEYRPFIPDSDPVPDDASYQLSDGSLAWMRCDSKSISILFGTDLFFNAIDQAESQVLEGGAVLGEPVGTRIEGVPIDEKTAENQALALLEELSFQGYTIARIEKARYINDDSRSNITVGYQVIFCRAEGSYAAAYNTMENELYYGGTRSEEASYRPHWDQEQIYIFVDQTGIRSFFWTYPTAEPKLVSENVAILSYEEIQNVIRTHLKNCLSWFEANDCYREWYAGRAKDLVDHIGLYYGIIPKRNDIDTFYYGPVWIVTIRCYPADADVPAFPYTMQAQYLHINAIDGSLINY